MLVVNEDVYIHACVTQYMEEYLIFELAISPFTAQGKTKKKAQLCT